MSDLRTLLHEHAPAAGAPAPASLVEDDLARGRTALRRHRGRRGASTTASGSTPPAVGSTLGVTSLVAYADAQPDGFTIDKVPAGWTVQDSGEDQLLLAPRGATDTGTDNVTHKIIVGLQGQATGVQPTDVSVGRTVVSVFTTTEEDAKGDPVPGRSKTPYVQQPSGGYLSAQVWDTSSWSDQQIAELGAGLRVTGEPTTVG